MKKTMQKSSKRKSSQERLAYSKIDKRLSNAIEKLTRTTKQGNIISQLGEFAGGMQFCGDKHFCGSLERRATNLTFRITSKPLIKPITIPNPNPFGTQPLLTIPPCPADALIEAAAASEIHKKIDKVLHARECCPECLCLGFPLSIRVAHGHKKIIVYTTFWQPSIAAGAWCRSEVNVDFDIEYLAYIGACIDDDSLV